MIRKRKVQRKGQVKEASKEGKKSDSMYEN